MEIRRATTGDVAAIQRVAQRSWRADYPDVISRESVVEGVHDWYGKARVREEVDRADTGIFLAERDEVVGFVHAIRAGEEGDVLRLYVDPDHRGEGVGSALLEAAVEWLREGPAERIRAMVLADNDIGNAFYRSRGFERAAETYETEIGGESYEEAVYHLE